VRRELQLEMEEVRRLRKVDEQRKEIEIGTPPARE